MKVCTFMNGMSLSAFHFSYKLAGYKSLVGTSKLMTPTALALDLAEARSSSVSNLSFLSGLSQGLFLFAFDFLEFSKENFSSTSSSYTASLRFLYFLLLKLLLDIRCLAYKLSFMFHNCS